MASGKIRRVGCHLADFLPLFQNLWPACKDWEITSILNVIHLQRLKIIGMPNTDNITGMAM